MSKKSKCLRADGRAALKTHSGAIEVAISSSPVERLVLVRAQFVDDGLDAEHEQLVAQVQPELEVVFAGAVVEQGIQERHDRRLEADVVPVRADAPVQVVDDCLSSGHEKRRFQELTN